jgi:inosine-uridine nucleoside N-ribohydrolase
MKPVILDCDPGHDDMAAIILASRSKELKLLGITAVAGNQTVDKTYRNARAVCTLIGRGDIPVFRGCAAPLIRDLVTAPHIHGKSGLDGSTLPEPEGEESELHAVDWMRTTLGGRGEPVTLIATGPLTNVAMLMIQEPGVKEKISNLVIMGGWTYTVQYYPGGRV